MIESGISTYAELKCVVEAAFATARDIHQLDTAQSFSYAYEEMWPLLSSNDEAKRFLAYTALMTTAKRRGVSFDPADPTGDDIREELKKICSTINKISESLLLRSETDIVMNDFSSVCSAYLN